MDDLFAAGSKLQPYLQDPTVVSVRANNPRTSWITYTDGRKERGPAFAADNVGLIELVRGLAEEAYRFDGIERRFDAGSPKIDCALPNGDRVFGLMVVSGEAMFVIRRHNFISLVTLEDLRDTGMLTDVEVSLLRAMVLGKFNLVITGGMGTGKTTLCRVCANTIPADERKVVLEDTPELGLERFPHLHPDISWPPPPPARRPARWRFWATAWARTYATSTTSTWSPTADVWPSARRRLA
jgi:Flp pilus assembly CpaF family ATPase